MVSAEENSKAPVIATQLPILRRRPLSADYAVKDRIRPRGQANNKVTARSGPLVLRESLTGPINISPELGDVKDICISLYDESLTELLESSPLDIRRGGQTNVKLAIVLTSFNPDKRDRIKAVASNVSVIEWGAHDLYYMIKDLQGFARPEEMALLSTHWTGTQHRLRYTLPDSDKRGKVSRAAAKTTIIEVSCHGPGRRFDHIADLTYRVLEHFSTPR